MTHLNEIYQAVSASKQPPVHTWQPDFSGEIDIRIDMSGRWWHNSEPFERSALVQLFSSILRFENGDYFLVTPVEKWRIRVEDVPLVITQAANDNGIWSVKTHVGDEVTVDAEHPVELRSFMGQYVPYVNVRADLWARIGRAVYSEWASLALDGQAEVKAGKALRLSSGDYVFPVAQME